MLLSYIIIIEILIITQTVAQIESNSTYQEIKYEISSTTERVTASTQITILNRKTTLEKNLNKTNKDLIIIKDNFEDTKRQASPYSPNSNNVLYNVQLTQEQLQMLVQNLQNQNQLTSTNPPIIPNPPSILNHIGSVAQNTATSLLSQGVQLAHSGARTFFGSEPQAEKSLEMLQMEEIARAERANRAFERLIQFVNIVGQVDSYITERARSFVRKIALLVDDDEVDRRVRYRRRSRL